MRMLWMGSPLLLGVLASGSLAQDAVEVELTPLQEVEALKTEVQNSNGEFFELYQSAETEEERNKLFEEKYVAPATFAPKFWALADAHVGTEASLEAMLWLLDNSNPKPKQRAKIYARLIEHHIESERLSDACSYMPTTLQTEEFLRTTIEKSPFHSVRGQATFALASYLNDASGIAASLEEGMDDERRRSISGFYGADFVEEMSTADFEDLRQESEFLYEDVIDDFGDLPHYKGSLAKAAASNLFEMRNLAIGMVAPQIQGEDVDGTEFKLTDYRGKVIMLDFWGHW